MRGKKIYFFCFGLIILFNQCADYRVAANGDYVTEFYSCYANDSLKVSAKLFGDLKFQKLTKIDKAVLSKMNVSRRNSQILFSTEEAGPNPYSVIGLYSKHASKGNSKEKSIRENYLGSANQTFLINRRTVRKNIYVVEGRTADQKGNFVSLIMYSKSVLDSELHDFYFLLDNLRQQQSGAKCTAENPFSIANRTFFSDKAGNYLLPLQRLRGLKNNYADITEQSIFLQALCNYYSLINEVDSVDHYWNLLTSLSKSKGTTRPLLTVQQAVPVILQRATESNVLMFNEAHTLTKHRYFLGTLLEDLYKIGYRYLALEALANRDSVNLTGYPSLSAGFYTREPIMGNLIRHAHALGYTLISYDSMSSDRERHQALNLFTKTVKKDPQAKVVVLAGHGHIDEDTSKGRKTMATHVKDIFGIDPITINQTDLEPFSHYYSSSKEDRNVYLAVPVADTTQYRPTMKNDLYIINTINSRDTDHLFFESGLIQVTLDIPYETLENKDGLILLLYRKNEMILENPVPVFARMLTEKTTPITKIKLPPSAYKVVIKNVYGDCLWQSEMAVEKN